MIVTLFALSGLACLYFAGLRIWPTRHWVEPRFLIVAEFYYAAISAGFVVGNYLLPSKDNEDRLEKLLDGRLHDPIVDLCVNRTGAQDYSPIQKMGRIAWLSLALLAAVSAFLTALSLLSQLWAT